MIKPEDLTDVERQVAGAYAGGTEIDLTGQSVRGEVLTGLLTGMYRVPRKGLPALRKVVQIAAETGVPATCLGATLAYVDSYRSEFLPANLLQALRDNFGAHTYKRLDKEGVFHTEWNA